MESKWELVINNMIHKINQNQNSDIVSNVNFTTSIQILNNAPYYSLNIGNDEAYIHLESFWRAISNTKIVFTRDDINQRFGHESEIDILGLYEKYFKSSALINITIRKPLNDLVLCFRNGNIFELFVSSCGYENWHLSNKTKEIICLGSGELAIM